MKFILTSVLGLWLSVHVAFGQAYNLKGKVTDKITGEGLPGASVQVKNAETTTGNVTNIEGNFQVGNLKPGSYTVTVSYIGYLQDVRQVTISDKDVTLNSRLGQQASTINEVEVIADVAVERETPVAFSAVKDVQIQESLSNRDLPMILNETPGVYATQGGGGTGDSRINIRGFDQRNVSVMVNGVPVNDMENGWVYWSNWDLGDVTQTMQVQRGLSASKLATPSVGGTINIITKGFGAKRGGKIRQEVGSNGYRKTSLMLSTGELKGNWSAMVYGSRRTSDGWVEGNWDDSWSYFGTISKKAGNHKFMLTGVGSPQEHGQRSFQQKLIVFDKERAAELGADTTNVRKTYGYDYNQHWNTVDRYYRGANGELVHNRVDLNERQNYYHKPQVNFNHFWQVSDRLFVSNVVYASYGRGGGVGPNVAFGLDESRRTNLQAVYDQNFNDTTYSKTDRYSSRFLRASVNNHRWYGFISSIDYQLSPTTVVSAGIDGRDYLGEHYMEVYDLMGGDFTFDSYTSGNGNLNADPKRRLREGDKFNYNYDGKTRWLGGYGMVEYKTNLWTAFVTGTVSQTAYKRIDHFKARTVTTQKAGGAGDTTFAVPYGKDVNYNGRTYTNADGERLESDWAYVPGFTVKAGANYNISEYSNVFVNVGYLSRAQYFNYIFDQYTGEKIDNINNEEVIATEVGYGITHNNFKANLNAYYTLWKDRSSTASLRDPKTDELIKSNITGLNARHAGIELEVGQEITRQLQLTAAIAIGDWIWKSKDAYARSYNEAGVLVAEKTINVNGVHVGDAAQNQFMFGLRYEPIKNLYFRGTFLLFNKYYASFSPDGRQFDTNETPELLDGLNPGDTYRFPSTRNIDLHAGYSFNLYKNVRMRVNGSVLNVLNEFYVTDVRAADAVDPYDIDLIEVFFNRGRTFTLGTAIEF